MALDNFKTEGPRTYKKNSHVTSTRDVIHIANGMERRGHTFLKRHEVHIAFKTPESMNVELPSGSPYFICSDCGKIASDYLTMLKSDLIGFKDKDWLNTALTELPKEFKSVPESEYFDNSMNDISLSNQSKSEDEKSTNQTTSSASSDEEFNSGLDSFIS